MNIRTALTFLLVLLLVPLALPAAEAAKPNVLLIVADDVGWADVGYHNAEIRTPNLDALVRAGVNLNQQYVMPQCTPTRVALMTGRYPSRYGPHCTQASGEHAYPFGTPTMASLLSGAGYDTALIGKWHMGSKLEWAPNRHGFTYSYGTMDGAVGAYSHRYRKDAQSWHRDNAYIEEEGHVTDLIEKEAVKWLQRERQGRPFFLYLPFTAPHTPLVEEARWLDANKHIEDESRRLFAAAVTHMDAAIGNVLAALDKSGQRDNTLIIFTSDNGGIHTAYKGANYPPPDPALKAGFSKNTPLRGGKGDLYEGGIRVPAFVVWPGKLKPRKHDASMHAIDWLPTIAGIVGFPADPLWDGCNVLGQLRGEAAAEPRELYWVWHEFRRWEGIRCGAWKLIRNNPQPEVSKEPGAWQLFDLAGDPTEKSDRAAAEPERVKELAARFEKQKAKDNLKRMEGKSSDSNP